MFILSRVDIKCFRLLNLAAPPKPGIWDPGKNETLDIPIGPFSPFVWDGQD